MNAHTAGPWHACGDAKCSCFTVMAADHPVAQITNGSWGDEYPSIRLVGPSMDRKAEAYMEQTNYGTIDAETARANWLLVAAAPELLAALQDILSAAVTTETMGEICQMVDYMDARAAIAKATGQ